jgi:hypothetical protein
MVGKMVPDTIFPPFSPDTIFPLTPFSPPFPWLGLARPPNLPAKYVYLLCQDPFLCWDEFEVMGIGTGWDSSDTTYTYEYELEPVVSGLTSETLEFGDPDSWMTYYGWQFDLEWVPTGVVINAPDGEIVFTQTGATTWTFVSSYPFAQTVQKFKQAGFVQYPQDYVDLFHLGQLDLRDTLPFCSTHVDVTKGTGEGGAPTTGSAHLDAINPWAPSPLTAATRPWTS